MGDGYEGCDLFPELFHPSIGVKNFNLIDDVAGLPDNTYDLIIHVHVLEHLPAWPVQTLRHLHRALKPDGLHLICFPIYPRGRYAAEFGEIDATLRNQKFGQHDHLHRFARADIANTLGAIFSITDQNSGFEIAPEAAERHNINADEVKETVFVFKKGDWALNIDA
ncbi:Methyltransferase domain protein [compost metagenome]